MTTSLSWQQLFNRLRPLLSRGFVDTQEWRANIMSLLQSYKANETDYKHYLSFSEQGYTKNLVESFGQRSNVIVMCWAPGQLSAFHAHEGSRCFVKLLAGQLTEQQVPYPTSERPAKLAECPPSEKQLVENQVSYIDDSIGLHKMINKSLQEPAVTLHIYLPAYTKCRIFTETPQKELDLNESIALPVTCRIVS